MANHFEVVHLKCRHCGYKWSEPVSLADHLETCPICESNNIESEN